MLSRSVLEADPAESAIPDPLAGLMKSLGDPDVTPVLKQAVTDGVMRMAANRSVDELAEVENAVLTDLFHRSR